MLQALKQSNEPRHLVDAAIKYLRGVKGHLVQKKKQQAEMERRGAGLPHLQAQQQQQQMRTGLQSPALGNHLPSSLKVVPYEHRGKAPNSAPTPPMDGQAPPSAGATTSTTMVSSSDGPAVQQQNGGGGGNHDDAAVAAALNGYLALAQERPAA